MSTTIYFNMNKKDTLRFLRSLLISKKGTYELGELLKDFKEETGYSLPSFGYKTTLDFLKSVPDTIEVVGSHQKIMIKPVVSSKSAHISSLVRRQQSKNCNNKPGYMFNSGKIVKQTFHESKSEPANVMVNEKQWNNKLGTVFADIKHDKVTTNDSLLDIFELPENNNEVDHRTPEFHDYQEIISDFSEVTIEPKEPGLEKNNVDDKIIKELNDIPKLDLKFSATIGQYIEVCVAVIWNPHIFTLQLRKFRAKLVNLICEMQLFYCEDGDKYRIPDSMLKPGLLCAAFSKVNSDCLKWFRAIILKHRYKNTILVGLIDYGKITEIEIVNIRFLHRQFGKLPPQALSGNLANIQPFDGCVWSKESIERFLNLVFERDLIAGIVDLNCEENWLSVALSLTDGPDLHINDTLVEENLAKFYACNSNFRICLPWSGSKEIDPLYNAIPKFWFYPAELSLFKNSEFEKKKCFKQNLSGIFFSYSQNNARLQEMFIK